MLGGGLGSMVVGSIMIGLRWARIGAALAVGLAAGCSDDGGGGPSSGDLGFATFRWQCAGLGDVACVAERVAGFPRGVAVGASFEASFVLDGNVPRELEAGWIELVGPKAELLSSMSGDEGYDYEGGLEPSARMQAHEQGDVTLMAMAQDETVADYTTLSLRPVTSLAVVRDCRNRDCGGAVDGDAVGSVSTGLELDVRVEPYGEGVLLVGHLEYTWQSLTPDVAAVVSSDGNVVTLDPRREGTAYLQVEGGGVQDTVAIEVVAGGPHRERPEAADGPGTDTGSDTDTGTGSDTDTGTGSGSSTGTDADTDAGTGTTTGGTQ
jgi:hypothetical protein